MTGSDVTKALKNWEKLRLGDEKYSYIILKPNAAKYYDTILREIRNNNFTIIGQYAIADYETVNMALHSEQPEAMKYIIPISQLYKDLYGNYGIIVVIAKKGISYPNFCIQVVSLKSMLRKKFEFAYMAYAFDISQINGENKHQQLVILSSDGAKIDKKKFDDDGTYMVFSINAIHSPDENVESVVKELTYLEENGYLADEKLIPKTVVKSIEGYHTFEFLKDMFFN